MKYIAIHHSAVSRDDNARQVDAVNNYHKDKWNMKSTLGWYGGYNYFIDVDGTVTQYRAVGEETMAQVGHNFDTVSICLAGNFDTEMPTGTQLKAMRDLISEYPELEPKFHADLQDGRTCPGKNFTRDMLHGDKKKKTVRLSKAGVGQVGFLITTILIIFGFDVDESTVTEAVVASVNLGSLLLALYGQFKRKDLNWGLFRK